MTTDGIVLELVGAAVEEAGVDAGAVAPAEAVAHPAGGVAVG